MINNTYEIRELSILELFWDSTEVAGLNNAK